MRKSDIPSTPGIYQIVNLIDDHFYIGSAVNLLRRKQHHLRDLATGKHKNSHLQRAYNLYGVDAFTFEVLKHVDHTSDLLAREQHFIDTLNPPYNISRTAGSNLGMKFTDVHRAGISAGRRAYDGLSEQMAKLNADRTGKPLSAAHRAKITANQTGRKLPPKVRAAISAAHTGRKKTLEHSANIRAAKLGKPRSPETIAKIAASMRGKKQPPEVVARRFASKRLKILRRLMIQPTLL